MERITFEIENSRDVDLLISFAKRIGITIVENKRIMDTLDLRRSRSIIERGCDISSHGNPVKWQRKLRKDRKMVSKERHNL